MGVMAAIPTGDSVAVREKVDKTDDPYYNPTFDFNNSEWKTKYDSIVDAVSECPEFDKLPNLDEFKALTGWVPTEYMTLTKFRRAYGVGTSFILPTDNITIYIANQEELDLLSNLIGNTAEGETNAEQEYYASGSYKLLTYIDYKGTTYKPLGNASYPFKGTFDGDGYELNNVKIIDDVETQAVYSGTEVLGIFGYTDSTAVIRNLGVTAMTIKAMYVLGGDAAFLCARNYGLIEDCYVNGKLTSTLTISNSTAGGICGENYGIIRGCYADAWVDVDTTSGAYSEPQPIATLNHTEDGAVVENCYYIKEAYKSLILNSREILRNPKAVNTKNDNIFGWHYKGDESNINGTGLSYMDFITNISNKAGVKFKNGLMSETTGNNYGYGGLFTLDNVRKAVGSCTYFDITYINNTATSNYNTGTDVYGYNIIIRNSDEWNTYCKLVNGTMPNETEVEQEFWTHTCIIFYNPENKEVINGKSLEVIDLYADDAPLGTAEHPYCGTISGGHRALVRYHLEAHRGGEYTSLIGYNAGSIIFDYVEIVGNNISQYINKGILCDTNTSEFKVSQFVIDNSYRLTGDNRGVNVYATDEHYSELADMDYMDIALVRTDTNGHMKISSGFAYQWYDVNDDVVPKGYNYIPVLYSNDTQYHNYSYIYCKVQSSVEKGPAFYYTLNSDINDWSYSKVTYNTTAITVIKSVNSSKYVVPNIRAYPTLAAPEFVDNKYRVYSAKNLIWLIKYAEGQDAVLMNTLDMGSHEFTDTPGVGYFNLDGELTDENDICNKVNIGVKKCYGIINLRVNDTKLSSNGTYNGHKDNNINWRNVYFIGGQFTYGDNLRVNYYNLNDSRWLGNNLENVHISMDFVYNKRLNDYRCGSTASNTATLSSFSGNLVINAYESGCVYPLTVTANKCIVYTNIVLNVDKGSYNLTGLAKEAYDSVFRGTTEKVAAYRQNTFIKIGGIAEKGQRLKADRVYDFSSDTTFPIYLFTSDSWSNTSYCLFSGTYRVKSVIGGTAGFLSSSCSYIACTPESVFDGNVGIVDSNHNCNDMLFLGIANLYIINGSYYMFATYAYNILNCGTINIHRNSNDSAFSNLYTSEAFYKAGYRKKYSNSVSMYLMGWNAQSGCDSNAVFAGKVKFSDDMQGCLFDKTSIYLQSGGGHLTNYSDFEIDGNIYIDTFKLFDESTSYNNLCINYGNIRCKGHSEFAKLNIISRNINDGITRNFGDISYEWTYGNEIKVIDSTRIFCESDIINYGNVSIDAIDSMGGVKLINCLRNCKYGINYGDINIDYHGYSDVCDSEKTYAGSLGGGINVGNIKLVNMTEDTQRNICIYAAGNENYGDITVDNVNSDKSFKLVIMSLLATLNNNNLDIDYIYNRINKCDINVTACDLNKVQLLYYDLFRFSKASGTENELLCANINIKDSSFKNLYMLQGVTHSTNSTIKISTLYNSNFDTMNIGGLATNVENINTTTIDNVNINNMCNYSGVVGSCAYNDNGYKHNNSTLLFKDCEIKDFTYSGIALQGRCNASCAEWINNSNFTMDNVVLKSAAYIDGIASNRGSNEVNSSNKNEKQSISNAYNFATMNINVSGYPVYISGISSGSQICSNSGVDNNIVVNASTINVTNDKNIYICGILRNDGAHTATSYVRNAINCGKIKATQTGNGKVNIYGITDKATTVQSVENFGEIETNASSGEIAAICGDATGMCNGWVNYGNTSNPNFNSSSVSTTVKTSNETGVLGFGINYGTFDKPLSSNKGAFHFIVDLSGNRKTIPDGENTYSNDGYYTTEVTNKQGKGYNDFNAVIHNTGRSVEDDTMYKNITYSDIENPEFAFRYCNPITTHYITSTTKQWYNGENLFEYTLKSNTDGELERQVERFDGDGGYVLCAVDANGKLLLGHEIEANLYNNSIVGASNEQDWWSDYNVNGVSFDNYIKNTIKQREKESNTRLYSVGITSVEQYETVENNMQNIQNISMLCPLQAPINVDGTVSNNNIVSIVDLYVLVNTYKNLENQTVNWNVDISGSADMKKYLYSSPYVYNNVADFKSGIESMVQNIDTDTLESNNSVELKLQEIGGITYAIIGYIKSESDEFYNILAVRLHSATTQPMGWLTSFSYPYKTVDDLGKSLEYTEAFKGSEMYYNENRGTDVYEGDGYTITKGVADGHTYPIYNMTVPYIHSTDGFFNQSYTRYISNSGKIPFNFNVQNISEYRVDIIDEEENIYRATKDCPTTGVSSADGTVIIKTNVAEIKSEASGDSLAFHKVDDSGVTSKLLSMSYINNQYKENNPFYKAGGKRIIVYGKTDDTSEEIVLFEVNITKTSSFENYIKRSELNRNWFGKDDESMYAEVNTPISVDDLIVNYLYDKDISTLATSSNAKVVYSTARNRGSYTSYPDYVDNYIDITAENGSTVTYKYRKVFPDVEVFKLNHPTNDAFRSNCALKNDIIIMGDSNSFYYDLVSNAEEISRMNTYSVPNYYTSGQLKTRMEVEKFDVLVDGQLVRTVSTPKNENYTENGIYDSVWGITAEVGANSYTNSNRRIAISKDNSVPKADLPDKPITIKTYVKYELPDGQVARFEMTETTFIKELNPDRKLLATSTSNVMASSYISEHSNEEAENVWYNGHNIEYGVDYKTLPNLYITDVVEPNCPGSDVTYTISPCATLEQKVNGEWVQVFAAQYGANEYKTKYTYTFDGLGAGYSYEYRIVAQDYTTEDEEKATHITYFTHYIGATTRNKQLDIEFKMEDALTAQLYNEIIDAEGNLSIQIKNMNIDQIKMQQTKFYVGNESLESNYYNISQGDYAILVNLPDGYTSRIKIIGISSEGYLQENPYVLGKRLRLPFANSQNIKLEVTLQRDTVIKEWSVTKYRSFYKDINNVVI